MIRIFLDTEFTGLQQETTLISLALVTENGKEFYAEFTDYNKNQVSDWILNNVIANLFLTEKNQNRNLEKIYIKGNTHEIKSALLIWLNQFPVIKDKDDNIIPNIEIWADVPHYDWVLFCELFGGALNIPKQIHYICRDLATFLETKNIDISKPRIELIDKNKLPENLNRHNALFDAKVGMNVLNKYL